MRDSDRLRLPLFPNLEDNDSHSGPDCRRSFDRLLFARHIVENGAALVRDCANYFVHSIRVDWTPDRDGGRKLIDLRHATVVDKS